MNDNDSSMMANGVIHSVSMMCTEIQYLFAEVVRAQTRPSVLYKPMLSLDGDMWCALLGEDLQIGCCGFGETPELAMQDFDKRWMTEKRNAKV